MRPNYIGIARIFAFTKKEKKLFISLLNSSFDSVGELYKLLLLVNKKTKVVKNNSAKLMKKYCLYFENINFFI